MAAEVIVDLPDQSGSGGFRVEIPDRDDWLEAFWEKGLVRLVLAEPLDFNNLDGDIVEHVTDIERHEVEALRDALTAILERDPA